MATAVVAEASRLAQRIQSELVTPALVKGDKSPVTVADFATSSVGFSGCSSIWPDFITTEVRPIVTAAVYRGFSLQLRLAADRAL